MSFSPKISVIIPVYNASQYLRECLDSVLEQTLNEIEVICVDDGSKDESLSIIEEYCQKDNRVNVISIENQGAGAARNIGLKMAKGEYLSFLDADDFFEKNMFSLMYKKGHENNADVVICNSDQFNHTLNQYRPYLPIKWTCIPHKMVKFTAENIIGNIFGTFVGWAWDKLFKRSFINNFSLEFQEQRTTNDLYFVYSSLVHANSIVLVNHILVHQRVDLKSSLSSTRNISWECCYSALIALKEELVQYGLYQKFEKSFINYSLSFLLWNIETMSNEIYPEIYTRFRLEWCHTLGISKMDISDFESEVLYFKFKQIMDNPDAKRENIQKVPFHLKLQSCNIYDILQSLKRYIQCHGIMTSLKDCSALITRT